MRGVIALKLFVVKSQLEKTNNELHTALKEKIDVEKYEC